MGFAAPIVPLVSAAATAVSTFAGGFGGGSAPPPPPQFIPPPPAPEVEDPSIQEAAERERLRRARAAGLSSTILTSGRGLQEEATVNRPTLLGQ